jgi:hypothetical protein
MVDLFLNLGAISFESRDDYVLQAISFDIGTTLRTGSGIADASSIATACGLPSFRAVGGPSAVRLGWLGMPSRFLVCSECVRAAAQSPVSGQCRSGHGHCAAAVFSTELCRLFDSSSASPLLIDLILKAKMLPPGGDPRSSSDHPYVGTTVSSDPGSGRGDCFTSTSEVIRLWMMRLLVANLPQLLA